MKDKEAFPMKSLMSLLLLTTAILGAAPANAVCFEPVAPAVIKERPDRMPMPYGGCCPDGMHKEFDESTGGYGCVADRPVISPLPWNGGRKGECPEGMHKMNGICQYLDVAPGRWREDRVEKMSAALGRADAAAAFFDAARGQGPAAVPSVSASSSKIPASAWKLVHTDPSVPVLTTGKGRPVLHLKNRREK